LIWNSTSFGYGSKTASGNTSNFTRNIVIPFITSNYTDIELYWNYTLNRTNALNLTNSTATYTQRIYRMYVTNCSWLSTNDYSLNFSLKDEGNLTAVIGDIDASFTIWRNASMKRSYSFDMNSANNHSICIFPENTTYLVDATIVYFDTDYKTRSYYLYHANVSNTTQNIDLYLLLDSLDSVVTITVKDAYGNTEPNIYMKIQRYYPSTGTYRTVSIRKTDQTGQTIAYLVPYDVFYKFILEDAGTVVEDITAAPILSTTLTLIIRAEIIVDYYKYYDTIAYLCNYVNATKTISCTATDTTGIMMSGRLRVYRIGALANEEICDESETSTSFTIGCDLGDNANGTYVYKFWANVTLPKTMGIPLVEGFITVTTAVVFGLTGVFVGFIVVGTSAMIGIWNPTVSILMTLTSLGVMTLIGMIPLSLLGLFSAILVGIIIIWRLKG